jgi:transposase
MRLKMILGVGPKTAIVSVVLTPVISQSGSSVKGRTRSSKIGNQKLRNVLFMCSLNACKYNKACRYFHERIGAKGKS